MTGTIGGAEHAYPSRTPDVTHNGAIGCAEHACPPKTPDDDGCHWWIRTCLPSKNTRFNSRRVPLVEQNMLAVPEHPTLLTPFPIYISICFCVLLFNCIILWSVFPVFFFQVLALSWDFNDPAFSFFVMLRYFRRYQ